VFSTIEFRETLSGAILFDRDLEGKPAAYDPCAVIALVANVRPAFQIGKEDVRSLGDERWHKSKEQYQSGA
jgi:hypothetical protein